MSLDGRITPILIAEVDASVKRLGVVLSPDGSEEEREGVLNPAATRTRDGKLLLYPRMVAPGNHSRIGIAEAQGDPDAPVFKRVGIALDPQEPYEIRTSPGGYGCEDARVTFVPVLDAYVMAYTAYGPNGPRIAVAVSSDGYEWKRMGLVDFSKPGLPCGDDKDGAFFPEPVVSPNGVPSLAFYHRPMLHISAVDGCAALPVILNLAPRDRESTRIGYVPLDPILKDRKNLLKVSESVLALEPAQGWGAVKNGGGTPPVRIDEGWFSLFHGVDGRYDDEGSCIGMRYSAGIVVHDYERPDIVRYRSPSPIISPETRDESVGIINNVVFPTGLDIRPGAPPRTFDVYYGMADARIGRFALSVNIAELAGEESAA
jgi:predicted GH43/DUF377 family glycosyl hydrolase